MIRSTWKDVHKLCASALPCIRNLNTHEFWCLQGALGPVCCGKQGVMTVFTIH